MANTVDHTFSLLTDYDIHLLREGSHYRLWEKLGSHVAEQGGKKGVYFAVWAPNATQVFVKGDFNNWHDSLHELKARWDESGIWEGFIIGVKAGDMYKYRILHPHGDPLEKCDPFAQKSESAPNNASIIIDSKYKWKDKKWMNKRLKFNYENPISIYEVHLGSWGRKPDGTYFSYRDLADTLIQYVKQMGFTHIELMPIMEHPFYGSWGYQITNYFAPTSRYGEPDDLKFLIDSAHKNNIGVILDWVPSHFPGDEYAIKNFDGTALYEHADPKKGFQPDWNSYIFNYGRNEVKSFLISNAIYWIHDFHFDGLRVDAVASILYLDYSRKEGEWIPNEYGGNENLEAIQLLKEFNNAIRNDFPGVITIAEESTAWPKVSDITEKGGLGFHYKWMMGWMHDTLNYFKKEPIYRRHHQNDITFSIWYFWSEHFVLSISHDEVVYGKGSLWNKMPGDDWHKFANLRLLFAYMFTHPGAKLIFMGSEFAQKKEWNHDESLDWNLVLEEPHKKTQQLVTDLNHLYTTEKALHENDYVTDSLVWTDLTKNEQCIICYKRIAKDANDYILMIANFDQQTHYDYKIDVLENIEYREIVNTDAEMYGGSGLINDSVLKPEGEDREEQADRSKEENTTTNYFVKLIIPPLSMILLKPLRRINKPEIKTKKNVLKRGKAKRSRKKVRSETNI
ncbi:MAG: 1,4-alpha-glucan branching protein GlgB [Fimbriimonadaceae bacterium]|nr:1,4-alpha-glucan branching protein GlgB [Chitinophagales bacterium]